MENNSIKAALTFSRFVRAIMSSDCAWKRGGRREATKVHAKTRVGRPVNLLRRTLCVRERLSRSPFKTQVSHDSCIWRGYARYIYLSCLYITTTLFLNDACACRWSYPHTAKKFNVKFLYIFVTLLYLNET